MLNIKTALLARMTKRGFSEHLRPTSTVNIHRCTVRIGI